MFSAAEDNESAVDIVVLQGERDGPQTTGHRTLPPGGVRALRRVVSPQVEVTFEIDGHGILNVSARDKDTGAQQSITIGRQLQPRPGRPRVGQDDR